MVDRGEGGWVSLNGFGGEKTKQSENNATSGRPTLPMSHFSQYDK